MRPSDRRAQWESDQDRFILQEANATKGDEAYSTTYRETKKRYFRRKTFRDLIGPEDTTELLLPEGAVVRFSELPTDVRARFGLKSALPRAKVVIIEGKVGFSFGRTGKKLFFPLLVEDHYVRFEVLSLPRSS